MENIISKINYAYEKGIRNPRFQEALAEVIFKQREEKTERMFNDREDR